MSLHPLRPCKLGTHTQMLLVVSVLLASFSVGHRAEAQAQESGLLDRIDHPDRTLAFPLTNKNFGKTNAYKDKAASVKGFTFGKGKSIGGLGEISTKAFAGGGAYSTKAFYSHSASSAQKSFGGNKLFDTKGYDVRDDREAAKSAPVRGFDTGGEFVVRGKRQDTYDDLLKHKNLSIADVREMLNKNQ